MAFHTFELERWQSTWENRVHINLSESGVEPPPLAELLALTGRDPAELLGIRQGYSQSDGTDALRGLIAAQYPGATADNVTVTLGSAEANFIISWALLTPGDHVAVMTPTYMQVPGLARNLGCEVSTFPLREEAGWEPDPGDILRAIRPGTKLVLVTNPNNPTGHLLSPGAREVILVRTREVGATLLADEVYQGAEHTGETTPTFWDGGDDVIAVNGLSKAWGLPGLRIGWIVSSPTVRSRLLERHDYTVICPTPTSDWLACAALGARDRVLARTRGILTANYPVLAEWLAAQGRFHWHAPQCGAIAWARIEHQLSTLELVERVKNDVNVLLVPGEHFDMPGWIRFGFGNPLDELTEGLELLGGWLEGNTD